MPISFEELFVFTLLLLGVVGIYYALKLHYIFAFSLVEKTDISELKKQKIEKIKHIVLYLLKVLLFLGLVAMSVFGVLLLADGMSLKALIVELWQHIPEGFWLYLLWILIRIAVLIIVMRYIVKMVYRYLEVQEKRTIQKKCYNASHVKKVFLRLRNTIKYTVVLGVIYRIVHFFPFLEQVAYVFLNTLILYFIVSVFITLKEVIQMLQTRI